ncbi:hypothetical protein Hanom_Chr05g00420361 [Helianthus anomalus]
MPRCFRHRLGCDNNQGRGSQICFQYKWSMIFIFVVQSVGVVLGTVAPICRCVVSRHVKLVFTVEKYWYQKLQDWNNSTISYHGTMSCSSLRFCSHQLKVVIKILENQILRFCIVLQIIVAVLCKITAFVVAFVLDVVYVSKGTRTGNLEERKYAMQLENEDGLMIKHCKVFEILLTD